MPLYFWECFSPFDLKVWSLLNIIMNRLSACLNRCVDLHERAYLNCVNGHIHKKFHLLFTMGNIVWNCQVKWELGIWELFKILISYIAYENRRLKSWWLS